MYPENNVNGPRFGFLHEHPVTCRITCYLFRFNKNKMSFRNTIKREAEVVLSKHSQPVWFRILKYILLGFFIYFAWGNKFLWKYIAGMVIIAILLHFWYRYKTKGWTRSYGGWKYNKSKWDAEDENIA